MRPIAIPLGGTAVLASIEAMRVIHDAPMRIIAPMVTAVVIAVPVILLRMERRHASTASRPAVVTTETIRQIPPFLPRELPSGPLYRVELEVIEAEIVPEGGS